MGQALLLGWGQTAAAAGEDPIRPGLYVPVDYQVVGGSSNAMKQGWLLRQFYIPEKIYGAVIQRPAPQPTLQEPSPTRYA